MIDSLHVPQSVEYSTNHHDPKAAAHVTADWTDQYSLTALSPGSEKLVEKSFIKFCVVNLGALCAYRHKACIHYVRIIFGIIGGKRIRIIPE